MKWRRVVLPILLGTVTVVAAVTGSWVRADGPEPQAMLLTGEDLPPDFTRQTGTDSAFELVGQISQAVATFRGSSTDGLAIVRSRAVVALDPSNARAVFGQLPALLERQGFAPTVVAPLGDESAAYVSPDTLAGRPVEYRTVVFRLDRVISMTTVVDFDLGAGLDEAMRLASVTRQYIVLALGPPAASTEPVDRSQPSSSRDPSRPAPVQPTPTASAVSQPALPAQPTKLSELILTAPTDIGGGLRLGGLSGLVSLGADGVDFVSITDRGPNRDIKHGGKKATAFLMPTYSPSIVKLHVGQDDLEVAERIPLRLGRGKDPVTGGPQVSGLPTGGRDEPGYDESGRRPVGTDPNGVDTEGLALDPRDGSYWICEEYGPSILHVTSDGTILVRLVPEGLSLKGAGYDVKPVLPGVLLQRKANRGFEGVAISPDGQTVFALMQSPLSIPDKHAGELSRNIRLLAVDVSGEPRTTAMYLYQAEPFESVGAVEQDDVKTGDLAAISATRLLVTERDSGGSASHRKVYSIDLAGATNLLGKSLPDKDLETMTDADMTRAKIKPVAKQLAADLVNVGFGHELVEGLAIVDDATIAVVNDNNFNPNEPSELMLVRLSTALR